MLTWTEIETIAARMGANALTVKKWRQRGVPARWKLDIISQNKGRRSVGAGDFPEPCAQRKGKRSQK